MPPHFTGKERDAESGNDYFGARYYSSSMGRWLSPDWSAKAEPVLYAKLDNPQSLNLYGYVLNNPLSRVDSDGHFSDLVYDGTAHTLTLYSKGGEEISSWRATTEWTAMLLSVDCPTEYTISGLIADHTQSNIRVQTKMVYRKIVPRANTEIEDHSIQCPESEIR